MEYKYKLVGIKVNLRRDYKTTEVSLLLEKSNQDHHQFWHYSSFQYLKELINNNDIQICNPKIEIIND